MNMKKKTKPEDMVVFDYNNLNNQNTAHDNCFTCEAEPCVCDCDCDGGCDYCDDEGACNFCDNNVD